ncbi:MAG TPA: hypothetical protein VFQ25_06825 [Ktedonobacterales bacterium]|nr:hypothetical protein [Ktedonobacterales bacterium]
MVYGRRMLGGVAYVCLLVTLVGCALPGQTQRLPPLRIPGLQRMDGLSNLYGDRTFGSVTPFQRGGGKWQVLLGSLQSLYVAAQDGSGLRRIALTQGCKYFVTVSADGQWVACLAGDHSTDSGYIELASLSASGPQGHWQMPLPFYPTYPNVALSPDGTDLALIRNSSTSPGCAVAVYALASDHSAATLVTTVTSSVFRDQGDCAVRGLGWSSDGTRLFIGVHASQPLSVAIDESVPIARLIQTHTSAVTIPASAFVGFPGSPGRFLAWNPRDDRVAFDTDMGGPSDGVETLSAKAASLRSSNSRSSAGFSLPSEDYQIWSVAWTPDGTQLLIVIGPPSCVDRCSTGNYAFDVYLYTPGGAK